MRVVLQILMMIAAVIVAGFATYFIVTAREWGGWGRLNDDGPGHYIRGLSVPYCPLSSV
jgi:hypothetical protein